MRFLDSFLIDKKRKKTRGIQERLLRTTDTPVQCLQAAHVSPGVVRT